MNKLRNTDFFSFTMCLLLSFSCISQKSGVYRNKKGHMKLLISEQDSTIGFVVNQLGQVDTLRAKFSKSGKNKRKVKLFSYDFSLERDSLCEKGRLNIVDDSGLFDYDFLLNGQLIRSKKEINQLITGEGDFLISKNYSYFVDTLISIKIQIEEVGCYNLFINIHDVRLEPHRFGEFRICRNSIIIDGRRFRRE